MAAALQPEWGQRLTNTERLVLLIMCQAALDGESDGVPGRTYWGGTDLIVLQMRGELPAKDSREYRAAAECVRAALRRLEEVDAVKCIRRATNALRAEYEIHVWTGASPVDNSTQAKHPAPD